jgi:hypothetical protein
MRVTRRQLRRIIREQSAARINAASKEEWHHVLYDFVHNEMAAGGTTLHEEGYAIIEALEDLRRSIKDELRGPTR